MLRPEITTSFIFFFSTAMLIGCGSPQSEIMPLAEGNASTLSELFDRFVEMKKEASPTHATSLGFKGFDGRWADGSLVSGESRIAALGELREQCNSIDAASLSDDDRTYFNMLVADVDQQITHWNNDLHLFPMSEQFGVHQSLPYVISDHSAATKDDLEAMLDLLASANEPVDHTIERLQAAIAKGLTQPKAAMKGVPDQIKKIMEMKAEETPFYQPFKELDHFSKTDQRTYQQRATKAINEVLLPAYGKLFDFVNGTYFPACRESVGLFKVPDGAAKYAVRIKQYTTTELTAQEIHDMGLSEVKRILGEMEKIKEEVGFQGDLDAFNEHLRTDPKFFHTSREALIEGYQVICKTVDPELVKLFGHLPRLPYGVVPVPEYLEKFYTTARYSSGSFETGKPGEFLANAYALDTRPKWEMEALSLHEAVPGHHLQISLEKEITDQPEFKKFLHYTVYIEGWGLYSESLGAELGLYKDPYSRYGQLTYEMWRAIRLVVDTGIHAFGWTRDDAIAYFKANSPKSLNDITVEIDRYIGWPGQALAYKIGELKIQEIKRNAQAELGEKFDIRAFHDKLLSKGSLPINVLESMMNEWTIELGKAQG